MLPGPTSADSNIAAKLLVLRPGSVCWVSFMDGFSCRLPLRIRSSSGRTPPEVGWTDEPHIRPIGGEVTQANQSVNVNSLFRCRSLPWPFGRHGSGCGSSLTSPPRSSAVTTTSGGNPAPPRVCRGIRTAPTPPQPEPVVASVAREACAPLAATAPRSTGCRHGGEDAHERWASRRRLGLGAMVLALRSSWIGGGAATDRSWVSAVGSTRKRNGDAYLIVLGDRPDPHSLQSGILLSERKK